jgi:hypothetical protein
MIVRGAAIRWSVYQSIHWKGGRFRLVGATPILSFAAAQTRFAHGDKVGRRLNVFVFWKNAIAAWAVFIVRKDVDIRATADYKYNDNGNG